jgi:N6-L-threonylcarbamoyladenine synthase
MIRRVSGSFDIRLLDGTTVNAGVGYKKVKVLEQRKTILIERRRAIPPVPSESWD